MSKRRAAMQLATNRQHLTTAAYASSDNLAARQAIYAYQQPAIDLPAWALAQARWPEDGRLLDIGCGNGLYLRRLAAMAGSSARLLGMDLSAGMLADLRRAWPVDRPLPHLAVGDVQALPLPDGVCDLVLAMHMLYHVPDQARAVAELRRVLRPGGTLLAATNGEGHLRELADLIDMAVRHVTGRLSTQPRVSELRFSLESGAALLRRAFAHVERRDVTSQLVIPEAGPIVRYAASMAAWRDSLDDAAVWPAVLAEIERLAMSAILAHRVLRVTTQAGVFVCD
jgi:SAM-dependent methyltransferase